MKSIAKITSQQKGEEEEGEGEEKEKNETRKSTAQCERGSDEERKVK